MLVFVVLIIVPDTAMPIKVTLNRIFAMSPGTTDADQAPILEQYDWTLITLEGEAKNLKQSKGRSIVINLWATWCPPCVAEMPSFEALYKDYGNKVDFYFVTSEEPKKVKAFMEQNGYTFPVYLQKFKAPPMLDENSLPTTNLIDSEGRIRIDKTGAANWNSDKVRELLDSLISKSEELSFAPLQTRSLPGLSVASQGYR